MQNHRHDPDFGSRLTRRNFLMAAGGAAATMASARFWPAVAGPFEANEAIGHFVPVDKKLSPDWVKGLFAKGQPEWFSGTDLKTIGMPVGGICAGQVYLSGDGRLIYWDIFNKRLDTGYGAVNYKVGRLPTEVANRERFLPAMTVDQGFAVQAKSGGRTVTRALDKEGFPGVRFRGEYPIGLVEFSDPGFPLQISLEAFSPFIPLNTLDSALPATVLSYTLKNTGNEAVEAILAGWLENKVCPHSGERIEGRAARVNETVRKASYCGVFGRLKVTEKPQAPAARRPVVFADFEGSNYGDWKVEGEAFGTGPAAGTLPKQQNVSGYQGKGLVNTFLGGDDQKQGKLTSPEFKIERPWISFLVGGGSHENRTCMNLVVDGKTVRTATGENNETLKPHNWNVRDLAGKTARLEIVDRVQGGWGHINVDQIEFRDEPMGDTIADIHVQHDYGTMGLACMGEGAAITSVSLPEGTASEVIFGGQGGLAGGTAGSGEKPMSQSLRGAVGRAVKVAPGQSVTLRFVVTWCFPNLHRDRNRVGNYYAEKFQGAADVAGYVAANFDRLDKDTRLWRDTYYESTLPWWLLDRLHSTASTLATTTCQWWRDGRFWAWEGCGCCHGTCGHVWNYAHTVARLFPNLERSTREMQDFKAGAGFNPETGSIGFRGEGWGLWAGDSQGGYVLKAYREHCCSTDAGFLKKNWPFIKKATQFLIDQDGNADGLIEGSQHQTYDQNYFGANTFVGALYLGALRAAEEMGREVGDEAFANTCRKVFEVGRAKSVEKLFNGEYYIQDVDLKKHPKYQYADGCLADQMFGQGWAHQVALGYLYPADTVKKSLESVWKYCWAPDIGPQNKAHAPQRWFAYAGEAGLFTCTWPRSKHLGPESTVYRDEIWTGIEYQVANHMIWEGMLTEALAICRGVHERYHPAKHNPWNEIECGDHYARGMASWGVLISLAGFEYHGPAGRIAFAPKITPESFRCIFTGAEGWGLYRQTSAGGGQNSEIAVKWGKLRVRSVALAAVGGKAPAKVTVKAGGRTVAAQHAVKDGRVEITLPSEAVLQAGQSLEVSLT